MLAPSSGYRRGTPPPERPWLLAVFVAINAAFWAVVIKLLW